MEYDVFISYSSMDKQVADKVCQALEYQNIKCWMAPRDIEVGQKYSEAIESAICNSKIFLIIFSKNSQSSPWVESELNIAFTEYKIIVPLRIDNAKLEGEMRLLLNNKQWIDICQTSDEVFENLVTTIAKYIKKQKGGDKQNILLDKNGNSLKTEHLEPSFFRKYYMYICVAIAISAMLFSMFFPKLFYTEKEPCITFTVNNVSFDMIYVKGDTFEMGEIKTNDNPFDMPKHMVTLSDFYIGKYTVTQALWIAVMNDNPSDYKGENLPVNNVSWHDCQAFVNKLNAITKKKFALLTEAQWEFAARGGIKSKGYNYSGSNNLSDVGWYDDNSDQTMHTVGMKKPNELGVYDMSGNIEEWCSDWYIDWYNVQECNSEVNPTGPAKGKDGMTVVRNGSFTGSEYGCRIFTRNYFPGESGSALIGFRLALIP